MENNTIKLIIEQYSDQNYWEEGQGEWDQFIDLETNYNGTNNYTYNEDNSYEDFSYKNNTYEDFIYKNNTSSGSTSGDYYGNSNFNIISFTLVILNYIEQLINYANRI